jgi:uncharacterized DUF497 family protein
MTRNDLDFEWDSRKAEANLRKHGVSFDEAMTLFLDPDAIIFPDVMHSDDEDRFSIVGYSHRERMLLVAYTYRTVALLRIISARRATDRERKMYEESRA